jgi:hypothetical protein
MDAERRQKRAKIFPGLQAMEMNASTLVERSPLTPVERDA